MRVSGNGGKGQAKKEVAVEAVGEALRGDLGEGPKRAVEGFVKGNVDTVDTRCAYGWDGASGGTVDRDVGREILPDFVQVVC